MSYRDARCAGVAHALLVEHASRKQNAHITNEENSKNHHIEMQPNGCTRTKTQNRSDAIIMVAES